MWAVLTWPGKENWRWNAKDFYATGREEISEVMAKLDQLELPYGHERALDFGCGIGRLTNALAKYFTSVYGVDVASSMIHAARKYVTDSSCHFILNEKEDLMIFDNGYFDFIYSSLSLQHCEPKTIKKYLSEFARILKPGGVLIFQLPSRQREIRISYPEKIKRFIKRLIPDVLLDVYHLTSNKKGIVLEMFGLTKDEVMLHLETAGLKVASVEESAQAGADWEDYLYIAVK